MTGFAIMFLFMSLEEFVGFHELTVGPIGDNFATSGFLHSGCVIPALVIVFVVGVIFLRFLFSLNPKTRSQFIFSAVLYIGGAVGLEMVGGYLVEQNGVNNFSYALSTNLEEMLEMLGVSLSIFSLMNYIHMIAPDGFLLKVKN